MCIGRAVKKPAGEAKLFAYDHNMPQRLIERPGTRTETVLTINMIPTSRDDAMQLDAADPLGRFRDAFDLPAGVIYLDGNSLGPPPKPAQARLQQTVADEWHRDLIRSWNSAGWFDMPTTCGAKIAKLIGASPVDVVVADSVSINIFKLTAALHKKEGRAIAIFENEFPTNGYILQGLASLTGAELRVLKPTDNPFTDDIGLLVISAVDYKTAAIADIAKMEARAARAGVSIIWDLSHATGLLPLDLTRDGARYAVGCGYKYLNGGPGAPAFVYAHGEGAALDQPLTGWMGHADPFAFDKTYRPADGARRFACGTPPILSLSALDAALDIFDGVDLKGVAAKAQTLGDLFLSRALSAGLETASPLPGERRGGHVSLRFHHGYEVVQSLIARGVVGDFRTPDLMRFGFSPLFLSYKDVLDAADVFVDVLQTEDWRKPEFARRDKVT